MTDTILRTVENNAKALMHVHGVGHVPFKFDNSKNRLGNTQFRRWQGGPWFVEYISISKHYAVLLPPVEIRDTVLHEIAHALAGCDANHGPLWKSIAREIGANPERCATPSMRIEAPVVGTCVECGQVATRNQRLPQRVYLHNKCMNKPLSYTKNGDRVLLEDMPAKYQNEYRRYYL